ncbi:MAG: phage integrase SAM-like domain-containing protein [Rikenellaceae bacterium]|nr:phage integrase SAM-like domain-containing protein [Rikenellaceae bacterium]
MNDQILKAEKTIKRLGNKFTDKEFERLMFPHRQKESQQEEIKITTKPNYQTTQNSPNSKQRRKKKELMELWDNVLKQNFKEGRIGNHDSMQVAKKSFLRFKPDIRFKDITPDFLYQYERWMLDRGCSITTVSIYQRALKSIINLAIDPYQFFKRDDYPFGKRIQNEV